MPEHPPPAAGTPQPRAPRAQGSTEHAGAAPGSWQVPTVLAVLAAVVLGWRGVRTALGDGAPQMDPSLSGATFAALAAGLCLGAAALAQRAARVSAGMLFVVLLLDLFVLGRFVSPPRLVVTLPLVLAVALLLVPPSGRATREARGPAVFSPLQRVASVLALALLLPVGFLYLSTGLVAPLPDLAGVWLVYGLVVVGTVVLTRRRTLWVLAGPVVGAGLWVLLLWLGETALGWRA